VLHSVGLEKTIHFALGYFFLWGKPSSSMPYLITEIQLHRFHF